MRVEKHRPLYIRPRQVPEIFGISERLVRHLMMRIAQGFLFLVSSLAKYPCYTQLRL
jgi:hypothetical protein